MSARKITITSKNISQKQWTNLLIELNGGLNSPIDCINALNTFDQNSTKFD